MAYSDIMGGREGFDLWPDAEVNFQQYENNINADPLFVDPDNGDYHLTADSPCIDAGDPDSAPDPDGTCADMGAYYFHQNQPPRVVAEIPDLTVEEDCGQVAVARLDTVFADLEEDEISYFLSGDERLGLNIDEANLLSLNPALNFFADSLIVSVSAFDEVDTVSTAFLVTVTPVNDHPSAFDLLAPEDYACMGCEDTTSLTWAESLDPDGDNEVHYLLQLEVWDWFTRQQIDSTWVIDVGIRTTVTLPDTLWEFSWPNYGCVTAPFVWWVKAVSGNDTTDSDSRRALDVQGTGAANEREDVVTDFSLQPTFPNPFNSTTTIRYSLPEAGMVTLAVYDLNGRLLEKLVEGEIGAGAYEAVWEAEDVAAGVYVVRLEAGGVAAASKLLLMK